MGSPPGEYHSVNIVDREDPVTRLKILNAVEQYYMHVDPNVKVLATTLFGRARFD